LPELWPDGVSFEALVAQLARELQTPAAQVRRALIEQLSTAFAQRLPTLQRQHVRALCALRYIRIETYAAWLTALRCPDNAHEAALDAQLPPPALGLRNAPSRKDITARALGVAHQEFARGDATAAQALLAYQRYQLLIGGGYLPHLEVWRAANAAAIAACGAHASRGTQLEDRSRRLRLDPL
jgi:hypothetical protein